MHDLGAAAVALRTVARTDASSDRLLAALVAVVLRAEGRVSFLHAAVTRLGAPSALAGVVHLILLASWLFLIDVPRARLDRGRPASLDGRGEIRPAPWRP